MRERRVPLETLLAEVRRHAREAHGMALTRQEALLLVFRAGLESGPHTISREMTTRTKKEER